MGLKAALTGGDESAVLGECERGEDAALANLPRGARHGPARERAPMVERQFAEIKEAHNHIRNLDRAAGAGA
jgi:uncharacterized protein (TIGR02284 family)